MLLSAGSTTNDRTWIAFVGSDNATYVDQLVVATTAGGILTGAVYGNLKLRDLSAWYHLQAAVDTTQSTAADRVKIYINGNAIDKTTSISFGPSVDTQVNNTVIHQTKNAASATEYVDGYLADIHFIDGQALDPTSFGEFDTNGIWQPIEYTGTYGTNGFHLDFADNSTAAALGTDTSGNSNTWTVNNISVVGNGSFIRNVYTSGSTYDGSATDTDFKQPPANGFDGSISTFANGKNAGGAWIYFRPSPSLGSVTTLRVYTSFLQEIRVNGTVASLSPAATSTAQWYSISSPPSTITEISVQGTPGVAEGRFSAIEVNSVVLVDSSNPGNDSLVDVPTNGAQTDTGAGGEVRGNYCTLNPLDKGGGASAVNGNLDVSLSSAGSIRSTIGMSSGKWYAEVTMAVSTATIGIAKSGTPLSSILGASANEYSYGQPGLKITGNVQTSYGASFTTGDVIGVAFNADSGDLTFYKNGSSQGVAFSGLTSGPYFFAIGDNSAASGNAFNFGQRPFAYTAPSGFKALNTDNLPAPVVTKPSEVMDVALYTGNNTARSITGIGFSPDFVWIKGRSGATDHALYDIVRGAQLDLVSNSTAAETTQTTGLTAFNSDGFSIGTLAKLNTNDATYAAWTWDAGSSTVTNTDGSISSQVRANASAGFSVVTYTGNGTSGATVGHGLGVTPGLIFLKSRTDGVFNWRVSHSALANGEILALNTADAKVSGGSGNAGYISTYSSSTFTLTQSGANTLSAVNKTNDNYVAYCFAPVAGYSAFGSYTGNGSADGSFVYTSHLPKLILIKRTDTTSNWTILDTSRLGYNVDNNPLFPNLSNAEGTTDLLDITSNGFKLRSTDASVNASGGTYIYASWASSPFNYSRAR
jgi:hypothetical protein